MAIRGWICETCKRGGRQSPWSCPTCRKEVCEYCFHSYGHCKTCAKHLTTEQMKETATLHGWDFS